MNRNNIFRRLLGPLIAAVLGLAFASSVAASGAYSIAQAPLFITISMPANIVFLFDDSGSLQWGHVPDWLGDGATDWLYVGSPGSYALPTNTTVSTPVTVTPGSTQTGTVNATPGTPNTGSVTVTPVTSSTSVTVGTGTPLTAAVNVVSNPLSTSVTVASGTPNSASVLYSGTARHWTFSCPSGYNESSPWTGSSSSSSNPPPIPSGDTCTQPTYVYSCPAGYTESSPWTGTGTSSSAPSGDTCTKANYTYSCPSGYNQSSPWTSSGSSPTAPSGDTCSQPQYTYSCASGYTESSPWTASGSSSSAPSGDTCTKVTSYTYSCSSPYGQSSPWTSSGSSSSAPSGDTCTQATWTYSCSSGYNQSSPWTSSGTSSTAPSGDTCTKVSSYTYSCASGYTKSSPWTSSGSSSTAPTGDTCTKATTTYSCWPGNTSSGSGSSMKCIGWIQFTATIDIANDDSSGGVYAPDTNMYKCACYNPLAYDPTQTYLPGYSPSGTQLSTSFTAAYVNPYVTSAGTVNLSTSYEATVDYDPSSTASSLMTSTEHNAYDDNDEINSCNDVWSYSGSSYQSTYPTCQTVHNPQNAFYYIYTPTSTYATTNGCTNTPQDDRCLTKVVVSATSGTGGTDERQNFANWFSFYRTRNLTVNTGANRALTNLGSTFRVAWRDLNTMASSSTPFENNGIKDWAGNAFDNRIATFTSTHRTAMFDWLERYPANNGTGLRTALDSIGSYYETPAGVSSPFAFNPQVTDSPEYVCRPNYAVVFTDGLWNDTSIPSSPSISNNDNTAYTLPDGTAFAAGTHPYSDSSSQSLADIAFYYWSHSLRSDLGTSSSLQYMPYTKAVTVVDSANNTASLIPYWNPANDPASWPHMITFTVGLGMTSTITSPAWGGSTYAGGYNDLVTGNIAWPAVSSNSSNNVYDLWHAAIDSRGQFFSVDTPQDVATAFNTIVNRIEGRVGSSSAIAVNSTRLDSDTYIYQAQFNSGGWTGEVLAYPINSDGSIGSQAWAASALIPAASSRSIYSWNDLLNSGKGGGISFVWANLNTTQQANLNTSYEGITDGNGSLRLNYLRGDQSEEQTQGGTFRTRSVLLGDIVNSNPEFVGTSADFGDSVLPGAEGSSYSSFVSNKSTRTPMLYVGANDGMMHAINANTGVEQFDYIPRGIYPNLSALTDPDYSHQYYVDGSDIAVDAYISNTWKTLLVGGTGAGGREIFLMDITNPANFAATSLLWDYDGTVANDSNMGYSIPAPTIARMHDGNWYVIFGNGYNSPNQHAVLYMYNINTGTLKTFDTGVGSASNPNGMSAPNPVDYDGDRIVDAIYAGDLLGNVWKLDVSSSTSSNWKFFTYGSGAPKAFFTAADSSGNVQPITDRVQVGLNSTGQVMVYFGTGTYFETNDNTVGSNPPVMSFYGLIDDKGNTNTDNISGRSNLLEQYVVSQQTIDGNNFRITTAYPMTATDVGWFIDLNYPSAQGERVVSDAVLDNGRVIFTTLIPQGNACQFGGISWLMELDSDNGGSLTTESPFDVNGDGKVNSSDFVTVTYTDPVSGKSVTATVPVGGEESNVGIIKTPGIITSGSLQYKYYSGSTGSIGMTTESAPTTGGRISWQVIQQ